MRPAAPLLQPLPRDLVERATALVRQGKQIAAVKLIRDRTGYDLRSAKEVSDALAQGRSIPTLPEPGAGPAGGSLADRARALRDQDRMADAIRLVATETGMSETEATRFVTGLD
ncbi:50S ribosomal protein L7/L12 [Streptomonospora sp. NEAU-YY374]|nr:50S ribosomal protein L7/L12 [Streptomonospora nanhaiensis]MBX9387877.1 50S ribosomal protein L7/L12 [Streptomonospora nanhaiensis]